jgi:hypothetical protein
MKYNKNDSYNNNILDLVNCYVIDIPGMDGHIFLDSV